jgi:hypothetical protein
MKTKELIKQLQELDPTGETEVSCGNHDIWIVEMLPAYYDGRLQLLIRDPELTGKCFDIIGAKYVSKGQKIKLTSMGVTDVLWDNPDAIVEYPAGDERYRESDDATRQASRDVELKVEMDAFYRWVKRHADIIRSGGDDCRVASDYAYEKLGLSPKDPVKDLPTKKDAQGYEWHASWNDRREAMWDDTLEVYWRGGWGIRRKGDSKEDVS